MHVFGIGSTFYQKIQLGKIKKTFSNFEIGFLQNIFQRSSGHLLDYSQQVAI